MRRLVEGVVAGERRAVARAVSLIESGDPAAGPLLGDIHPHTGRAHVIGVTGPPGAGKSSLVRAMIEAYRAKGRTVAVLAVDPSSPFTGGALLGDRIRMRGIPPDGVFIRSMAGRRHLGGLALAAPRALRVLDAAGYDRVIVETIGVGQSEIAVATAADHTVLVLVPGTGDVVQSLKAGVMEIGDVIVVNKADRDGAEQARQELAASLRARRDRPAARLLSTVATTGSGVGDLVDHLEGLFADDQASGALRDRRRRRLQQEALDQVAAVTVKRAVSELPTTLLDEVADDLVERRIDPDRAARTVLDALHDRPHPHAASGSSATQW